MMQYDKCIGDDTKAAGRRSPNCIRKAKISLRSVKRGSVPLPKVYEKLLSDAKFHWNRAIGWWVMAKNDFQYSGRPPSWNLKISYLVMWLSSSSKYAVVYQISSKSDIFSLRFGDLMIYNMADVRHFIVEIWTLCHTRALYRHVTLLPSVNFRWNRTTGCWVVAKQRLAI